METPLIQHSTDYSHFKVIIGNRPLNQKKIDKLVADIENGFNMLPYVPVIVNILPGGGSFGIIDGQHRIEAARRTGNPVYYVVADNLSLKQIANLNSRSERWKPQDFLNCYVQLGSEDYKALNRFILRYPINIMAAVDLLMYNNSKTGRKDGKEIFESGEFKVAYHAEAIHLANTSKEIFGNYKFSHDRYLLQALQVLQEKQLCDFESLKQKLSAVPDMLEKQPDKKKYLESIERVYNYKVQNRDTIY